MDKKITVRDYLSQTCMIFGITVLLLSALALVIGDIAAGFSTIFCFGGRGLPIATMFQFFAASAIISLLRTLFLTDNVIRDMALALRMTLMFASLLAVTVAFVLMFGWFPADNITAWVCFAMCFTASCAASTLISSIKEKQDNATLEKALEKFKEEH